jgi:hypothetical protein
MAMSGGANFEYHKDKEKTEKNRIGKFFTVGDVGYLDDDDFLFLSDRKIDMIISGGANIYPAEIENVLLSHPKVVDAAVFGIPDDDWGEQVKAVSSRSTASRAHPSWRPRSWPGAKVGWPSSRRRRRSTSPMRCRGTRTESCTSASSATPTGKDASGPSDRANGLASVKKNLTTMLAGLAPAAPSVRVIGMNYYDPYLGDWLGGGATRTLALGSLAVVAELNSDLESVYGGPAVTADVQDTFKTADDVSMVGSAWGRIPVDVDRACSWLDIICHRGEPEGFGDDPNITGQMKIAAAFERLIGRLRAP